MSTSAENSGSPGSHKSPTSMQEPSARMKQLVQMSHNISVDRNISIDKYFNSGRELIRSASALESKGDIERAFVLYLRYMTLFLEKLIHHPEYNKADKNEKKLVKDECNHVFDLAEKLKKRILEQYEKEYKEVSSSSKNEAIVKRSLDQQTCSPKDCDVDDIDRKFNFKENPLSDTGSGQSKPFDPFNIDQLKQSFSSSSN